MGKREQVVVMDGDYYGMTMADGRRTEPRPPAGPKCNPPCESINARRKRLIRRQYCVVFLSYCLRTEPPPFLYITMSGSALVGALTSGTILAGLIITSSKPENPAYREASWRAYMRNLKWDSEAL